MSAYRGTCSDLDRAGVSIDACCSSCHEDTDYGYDMCQPELPNGDWIEVCCRVRDDLDLARVQAALDAAATRPE